MSVRSVPARCVMKQTQQKGVSPSSSARCRREKEKTIILVPLFFKKRASSADAGFVVLCCVSISALHDGRRAS
jgi:hypothetical protein